MAKQQNSMVLSLFSVSQNAMQKHILPEIVQLNKKPTDRSELLWFRMSKRERCRFGEFGRIGLLVWESFVTWHSRVLRETGTQGEHPQGETLGMEVSWNGGTPKSFKKWVAPNGKTNDLGYSLF